MNHILNVIKKELVNSFQLSATLAEKVAIAQESYFKDKDNEFLFNNWKESMEELSKNEQAFRHLKSAYKTMCAACCVEEQEVTDILREFSEKEAKKAARKPRVKKANDTEKESK